MGVDTQLYFANRVSPNEIANAIEKEFGVKPDLSELKFEVKQYDRDYDRHYGYIRFSLDSFTYSWYFFQFNHISGGERGGTNPDTISGFCCDENKQAMARLAKYFGAWIDYNDCDDKEYGFIERTVIVNELNNRQKLEQLVSSEIDFKYCESVIQFIEKNKESILKLNFGIDT